jgi:hypothetical protein
MVQVLMKNASRRETLRLLDLKATRMENRPKRFRRMANACGADERESYRSKHEHPTVIPERANNISNEPLPVFSHSRHTISLRPSFPAILGFAEP